MTTSATSQHARLAWNKTDAGCHHDHIGVHPQKIDGMVYVGLNVPAGRLTLAQADALARLAEEYGSGELRLTPAQNVLLPNVPCVKLDAMLAEPLLRELSPVPSPFLRGLTACAGNTFCTFSRIDTKARALELARYLDETLREDALQKTDALETHVSGCMNSCANPWVGQIGLIGKRSRMMPACHCPSYHRRRALRSGFAKLFHTRFSLAIYISSTEQVR